MNAIITPHDVLLRFAQVRRAILTHRLLTAILAAAAVFVGVSLLFATIDFFLELPRELCIFGLCLSIAGAAGTLAVLVKRAWQMASPRRAAAEMERRFQSIGQRLRTTLDLAGRSGVDKLPLTLALANETNEECDTVDLESIVPRKHTLWCAVLATTLLLGVMLLGFTSPMWSVAISRALGLERSYTQLSVSPGDRMVDEGTPLEVALTLTGRTNRDVKLLARVADEDAEWVDMKVTSDEASSSRTTWGAGTTSLSASLGQIGKPHEYQFVTSVGATAIHRIDVRYPIRIEAIELTVKRPEYTGLEDRVFEKTDVTVLEGSEVVCRVRTQRPLASAHVDFSASAGAKAGEAPQPITAEKSADGTQWSFRFAATEDAEWTMVGGDSIGTPMELVEGKVRVKKDRPPKLRWSSPADSLFVHTLAEIPMTVSVEDDYGLSEAAIRFEISGNDGYELAQYVAPLNDDGSPPTARKVLENVLPLEHFPLTEKDYIAYYAYAIDNRPGEPHIVESERRYVDVRQLKIDILLRDDDDNNNNDANREALATLDELIGRQRYLINRSRTLRAMDAGELSDKLGLLDRHVEKQSDLADLTRLVGERLQERGNDNLEAMFQAEASMIQAADSLTLADFEAALPQQEDAQRFLVEARTEIQRQTGNGNIRSMSGNNPRPNMLQMVRQRLRRRNQGGDQQQAAQRNLVARIRAAAARQVDIAGELASQTSATDSEEPPATGAGSNAPNESPANGNDEPEETADAEMNEDQADSEEELSLGERQTALLEEATKIQEELGGMPWPSSLIPDRMQAAVQQMDEVTIEVNGESPSVENVEEQSREIAVKLMELAINIELVNPPDPAGRLAGTRDLTASLAELERDLNEAPTDEDAESEPNIEERAEAVMRRAETLVDVATAAADADDVQSQTYADTLALWMSEEPLLDTAKAAANEAEEVTQASPMGSLVEATAEERELRAETLAKMARSLDDVLREILEPELERLRQLEATGVDLQEQLENEGADVDEEVLEFAEDLERGRFGQLAEQLKRSIGMPDRGDGDSLLPRSTGVRGAVSFATEQIRDRIRELILRELEADRDGPVPPQYRTSVDDYFRRVLQMAQ